MKVWIAYANESYDDLPTNLGVYTNRDTATGALIAKLRAHDPDVKIRVISSGDIELWGPLGWWLHPGWLWLDEREVDETVTRPEVDL